MAHPQKGGGYDGIDFERTAPMVDPVIEAALESWGDFSMRAMRRALAAAYRAEADRIAAFGSGMDAPDIRRWLYQRAAELEGQRRGES